MDILGFIPARGGSKRIPRKNIKDFLGKPIISYPIKYFHELGIKPIVSTEDAEIGEVARKYGAEIYKRPIELADDKTGTAEVVLDYLSHFKKMPDYVLLLYATAVFAKPEILKKALELIKEGNGVFPMVRYSYPPQRGLKINEEGKVKMIDPNNYRKNTQDFEIYYHDVGQFYLLKTDDFLKEKKLFLSNSIPLIIDDLSCQDVDNESDWKIAEIKFKALYG